MRKVSFDVYIISLKANAVYFYKAYVKSNFAGKLKVDIIIVEKSTLLRLCLVYLLCFNSSLFFF